MWEGVFEYDPSLPSCLRRIEPIRLGKNFSVKIYGEEVAKQLAIEFRIAKIKELNEKGYGYTEHHGL